MFNIDFQKIAFNLLPHFLRQPLVLLLYNSIAAALKSLNTRFNQLRDAILYKLTWTGQTIYLEHFLNDQHDPGGRGIFITNTNVQNFTYFRNKIENAQGLYLFNKAEAGADTYLINNTELIQSIHFIVNIPAAVPFDPLIVNRNVATYAQAGKTWSIVTF